MELHTEKEWETLPHIILKGADWDPTSLDNIILDKEKNWFNIIRDLNSRPGLNWMMIQPNQNLILSHEKEIMRHQIAYLIMNFQQNLVLGQAPEQLTTISASGQL